MATATRAAAQGYDVSAPAILQVFESTWQNLENRAPDVFMAGYGGLWVPPPGRADSGNFSVGYDVYDRFDLGRPGAPTLYGTETGVRAMIGTYQRFGSGVYADLVWNHNGFRDNRTPGFVAGGGYPGFILSHPDNPFGDFHDWNATGEIQGRLSGLIDIDHARNFRYIRSPVVAGDPRNLPGDPWANAANPNNRRFYSSHDTPGRTLFDPRTGETFTVHDFRGDGSEITAGTPVEENATGYLMRNAQWLIQDVGFDGFRLDAVKHMQPWVLDYLDRAVYNAHPRRNLDGSQRHVFCFGEALDGDYDKIQSYIRKDIDPSRPTVVGGNRDALDFPLQFALKANLSSNGLQNDWRNLVNASIDRHDDGLANNGSQGVAFDASHDDFGADLGNVSNAYLALRPGNWVVYHNARQFGDGRDFPKDGRGDALGGLYSDTITTLVDLRNTHGRGNYRERHLSKETLVYEREGAVVMGLSNRTDGFVDRQWIDTGFAAGMLLVEMTGNARDKGLAEVLRVENDGRVQIPVPGNAGDGRGYVAYGLPTPQGTLTLSGVDYTLPGGTPTPQTNGTTRLADVRVVTSDTFGLHLETVPVRLLGLDSLRDVDADGDAAFFRVNAGIDANRSGGVDFVTPGTVVYGFENFLDKNSPLATGGDGQFRQTIHSEDLVEGYNFIEVRAFRRRTDGGVPVFSTWREVVYVDLLPPVTSLDSVRPLTGQPADFRQFRARSDDGTADNMHFFANLGADLTDAEVLAMVSGGNQGGQIDRDLWAYGFGNLPSGNHALTVVTYEITGNFSVERFAGINLDTGRGWGVGDVLADGSFTAADVFGPGGFEQILWSRNRQYHPAADLTGDGRVDARDLWLLRPLYEAAGATEAAAEARRAELRRGDLTASGSVGAADVDFLYSRFGSTDWLIDLDGSGVAAQGDVDALVRIVLQTEYGDANLDGIVWFADLDVLRSNWLVEGAGWAGADFTGDGITAQADLDLLRFYFGFGTDGWAGPGAYAGPEWDHLFVIPEPGATAVVVASAVLLLRRRRENPAPVRN